MEVPWAATSKSYTYEFERWAIDALQATKSQTAAAKLLRCSFDRVNRILHGSVARGMQRRTLEDVEELSIDEKAFQRGHRYATILSDSKRGIVLDIGEGREKEASISLCKRALGEKTSSVRVLTSDMWRGYLALHEALLSHARLIHDRFHLVQYLTKSQDKVRRREVKCHPEILKNSRYAFLKNEENRTERQEELFRSIQKVNLEVSVAWRLRQEFKDLFGCSRYAEAKQLLLLWIKRVKESAVQEVIEVAERFERHFIGVCNALCHSQSNARAERINGKIQAVKTAGRGYRKFENFRSAVLFFCGGLELYPQLLR